MSVGVMKDYKLKLRNSHQGSDPAVSEQCHGFFWRGKCIFVELVFPVVHYGRPVMRKLKK